VTAALALLGYALIAAWCVPALLVPLTRHGASVRVGLAAWLAAMASAGVAFALALQLVLRTVVADWPKLTMALCRSVAGGACTPQVYRSALYSAGVAALAIVLTFATAVALWRYGRRVQRASRSTRVHAEVAHVVGRELGPIDAGSLHAGLADGGRGRPRPLASTVILDDPRPTAYCVAGRPPAIVVTSGALAVLDPPQLAAVLAHERAHLAGRHHTLALITRCLAATFPGVPLFIKGSTEVARLAEMAADDAAARANGRTTVVSALLAIVTGAADQPVPAGSLATAAYAVPARVERMLRPSSPAAAGVVTAALSVTLAVLTAAPLALAAGLFW
jgi:Zn-dependent protease with chaperone function